MYEDRENLRPVTIDYGCCIFCGQCAEVTPEALFVTMEFELAARSRQALVVTAGYALRPDGTHDRLVQLLGEEETIVNTLKHRVHGVLGRSLAIREVDAGSCNGCEPEIVALNNPVHDIERLGIHFVASPRYADMLLVTGPVARNMQANRILEEVRDERFQSGASPRR